MKNSTKTLWQRFYSFFGFWTFHLHTDQNTCHLVVYWCCLPYGPWFRKFDLFRINVSKTHSLENQKKTLAKKLRDRGEDLNDYPILKKYLVA